MWNPKKEDKMKEIESIKAYQGIKKRSIFIYAALFIVLIIAIFMIFAKEDVRKYGYLTSKIEKGDLTVIVSATGYIEPQESVEVGTEVSGTILEVYVDDNDIVKKDQPLALLDKKKFQSVVDQNNAMLEAAKATLENKQAKLTQYESIIERNKALRASTNGRLPSTDEWESDWSDYLSAKADVANAKAQVSEASFALASSEYDLDKTLVVSPTDGIVLKRDIDPGQTVAATFETPVLFTIAKNLTQMKLSVDVDEADIGKVKEGQRALFSVDAYVDHTFEATIKKVLVNSETVDGVVTYETIMDVNNSALLLRPGMSADADITTKTIEDAFIVPRSALLFNPVKEVETKMFQFAQKSTENNDPKPHVWLLEDDIPRKVYVKVLESEGAQSAISSDELKVGDAVIIAQEKEDDNA